MVKYLENRDLFCDEIPRWAAVENVGGSSDWFQLNIRSTITFGTLWSAHFGAHPPWHDNGDKSARYLCWVTVEGRKTPLFKRGPRLLNRQQSGNLLIDTIRTEEARQTETDETTLVESNIAIQNISKVNAGTIAFDASIVDNIVKSAPIDYNEAAVAKEVQNQAASISLFDFFCSEIVTKGKIRFRIQEENQLVVVMNEYDPKNGRIKTSDFIHVTALVVASPDMDSSLKISCTCSIFISRQKMNPEMCCHCTLMCEILKVKPLAGMWAYEPSVYVSEQVLQKMACSEPVINLQSSRGVRFSVVAGGTPSIISINTAPKSARKVVKCRCSGRKAARTVDFLQLTHTDDLCEHLAMLRVFLQLLSLEGDDSGSEVDELSDGEMSDAEIMDSCKPLDELGRPLMNMHAIKSEISST